MALGWATLVAIAWGLWWLHNITALGASVAGASIGLLYLRGFGHTLDARAFNYHQFTVNSMVQRMLDNVILHQPVDKSKVN